MINVKFYLCYDEEIQGKFYKVTKYRSALCPDKTSAMEKGNNYLNVDKYSNVRVVIQLN